MAIIEVNQGKGITEVGRINIPIRPEDVNKKISEIIPVLAKKYKIEKGTIELQFIRAVIKKDQAIILPNQKIIGGKK